MARQLLQAGVRVRLAKGQKLTPVYHDAGRDSAKLGGLMGSLHAKSVMIGRHVVIGSTNWTEASRANQECSVHLKLDLPTHQQVRTFFDRMWDNAEVVTQEFLFDAMTDRLRVQAAKAAKS